LEAETSDFPWREPDPDGWNSIFRCRRLFARDAVQLDKTAIDVLPSIMLLTLGVICSIL